MAKIVFIVGTGRSGTNMLGRLLASHPDIHVTIEQAPMFGLVTEIVIRGQRQHLPALLESYRSARRGHAVYADKSHHGLWLADELVDAFGDDAQFIGIERSAPACVASMLRHAGVRMWIENYELLPVPNPFLGITEANAGRYPDLSLEQKCALRWRSHQRRMAALQDKYGFPRLCVLQYESVVERPDIACDLLSEVLEVDNRFDATIPTAASARRWQQQLSTEQIGAICDVAAGRVA